MQLCEETQKLEDEIQAATRDFQIEENIPGAQMKFASVENSKNNSQFFSASCSFQVSSQIFYALQVLITFEEEKVVQNVIAKGIHYVKREAVNLEVTVQAQQVSLNIGVRFQVHIDVSKMKISVTEIPDALPEDQMDKLELSFCKSGLGGGEVECMHYDKESHSAVISFVEEIADRILKKKDYPLMNKCHRVTVALFIEKHLKKYSFSGVSQRMVLLTGLEAIQMDEEMVEDLVSIHFQWEKNGGEGNVKYSLAQPYIAYFKE
ncbi:LOW QUALITY PROTEIN: N-myc-interactor [Thomomys bottae]